MSPTTHYRTCNLCEAMCGLEIKVEGKQILSIKGDKEDVFSHGHVCPKATALADVYADPDRLKFPVRRTEDGWEQIGWDEAFDEVVHNIQRIQAEHGRDAVGLYAGNPNVHNLGAMLYNAPFIRSLRTKNRFSASSVDQLPHQVAALLMFGHQQLWSVPDVDRTDYFLMLGANPLASNGSLMTAAGIGDRLKKLQSRGGKLVVIDPRRTETAVFANEHHFIKPSHDVLFLLAIVHTLIDEGLAKPGRLAEMSNGLGEIELLVAEFKPEMVADRVGITAETIRRLTREFAQAERAVCYGRMGVSTQQFGGVCQWLINLINVLTGNLDSVGGSMFTLPAIDIVGLTRVGQTGAFNYRQSRVRGLPAAGGEYPSATLADEILTPGVGQIRGMVTLAGNPVLSTPNGRRLEEAFSQLEFMVSIDIYINETTRHANIILPPTTGLETAHYDLIFHTLAVRNTAKYSPPLFEPEAGMKHDWQILKALRERLEGDREYDPRSARGKLDFQRRLPPEKILDLGLRFGPYGANNLAKRKLDGEGLKLHMLKTAVHGIDLGPLQPILKDRLCTKSGKIELLPEPFVADLVRVKTTLLNGSLGNNQLMLIGRRHLRSNNSWMHNSQRLVKGKNRCTLLMNPQDTAVRDLSDGQLVKVCSRVGDVTISLQISEDVMPGVVSVPHGWGHDREGVRLQVAQAHAGVSVNDLTDERLIDQMTGNAAVNGVPVEVVGIT